MALLITKNNKMLTYYEKHSMLVNENYIRKDLFKGNMELIEVMIPEGIETIQANAFDGCGSLARISIPASLRRIERNAFTGSALTDINIPDILKEVDCWLDSKGATKMTIFHPSPDELIENLKEGYAMDLYFEGVH